MDEVRLCMEIWAVSRQPKQHEVWLSQKKEGNTIKPNV